MSYGRGATLLSALIGVTGLLTYGFHSLAAHALGRERYGVVGVLWAAVFLTAGANAAGPDIQVGTASQVVNSVYGTPESTNQPRWWRPG